MSPVRIGFIGVGSMGQCAHLKHYVTLPDVEVVALAELRPGLRAKVAARYGVPRTYATHTELLANEQLDGLVASQLYWRHGGLLPDLYQSGLPVFSEKPLAASLEVGERLVAALQASQSWHMVGYHKRSDPATECAQAEIARLQASGELGRLTYVRLLMPAGDWVANGFSDLLTDDGPLPEIASDPPATDLDTATFDQYSRFVNYYIHQLNLLRFLLGEPYAITYADPSGVLLAGQSRSGVACAIEMTPYTTTLDWQESAFICFEHGTITLELPAPLAANRPGRVTFFRDPGPGVQPQTVIPQLPWVSAMRQQAANFVAAIRGERRPPCEAPEALEDLRLARDYIRLFTGR